MLIDLLESSKAIGLCPMGNGKFCAYMPEINGKFYIIYVHKLSLHKYLNA